MPQDDTDSRSGGRWSWRRVRQAFGANPDAPAAAQDAESIYRRGLAAEEAQRAQEAAELYRAAIAANPERAEYHYALAAMLKQVGRTEEAAVAYRAALARKPYDARIRVDLGLALIELGRLDEAQAELEQARALAPDLAEAHHNLGILHHQYGRLDQAIAAHSRALELAPDHAVIHSNLLFILNYSARHSAEEVLAEHKRFGARHVQPAAPPRPDPAWPRKLRIGYVSPDFRSHVVASFMLPIFAKHDRAHFEVYGYYSYPQSDDVTAGLRRIADNWLDCAGYSDAELAEQIRTDRIDILVDLAGHTVHHRLKMFALRPAPLQLSYLGYPNTTGMTAIDYRITDARADPPGESDALNVERLARLPKTFLCYRPGPRLHETGAPPSAAAGFVTFGCFNNFQKLSDPFFEAAARVLQAVPNSRLLLKAKPLGVPAVAQQVQEQFARAGIDKTRLTLIGWQASPEEHIGVYRQVDIALDSFPYNGTTTTCEALWMGVPVMTFRGDRHASRVGASLLETVGLGELVAQDVEGYVRTAAQLAGDAPRLAALRAGMRERMRASALMDEAGFVRDLEACYAELWQEKLKTPAPALSMDALLQLWDRCHDAGEGAAFVDAAGLAIAAGGATARLYFMLGCTFEDLGRLQDAAGAYEKALQLEPGHAKAANNLGCLQEVFGELDKAEASYDRALKADPQLANAVYNRANLWRRYGRLDAAEADLRRALALVPEQPEWMRALADVHLLGWRLDEAEAGHRAALALEPTSAHAHFGLGNAQMLLGRADEAEISFRRGIGFRSGFAEAHSNLLLGLHYRKGADAAALFEEHLAWAKRHTDPAWARGGHPAIERTPGRRLNIGYISPNLHRHSVASFLEPLLAAHDKTRFRVFCYSDAERQDDVTARLRGLCDEWRELRNNSSDDAARIIREDRIDVLVDLAGHTGGGRPLLFARKVAPVQIAWLGYPNTCGLAQMDYRLTDADADPPGDSDRFHSEKLLRLPGGFLCFQPEAGSPEAGEPPSAASGHITFGCFNNLAKLTPEIVVLWARLLAAVPGSRLMLKSHGLGAQSARSRLQAEFAAAGIAAGRLLLLGPEDSPAGHLGRYRDVDIALDTYPYNGTTTTCEALWMGVPVITLAGPTHVTRVGASILKRLALDELVAASPEEYLARASALAGDAARLRALRAGLRARMRASPLMDGPGFARTVETAYQKAWTAWLAASEEKKPMARDVSNLTNFEPLRLHVGGKEKKEGWKILNIQAGPDVDFVGSATELGQFSDGSVDAVYASHVLEHLGYKEELPRALTEFHRVLAADGKAMISVPDFETLCRLFVDPRHTMMERYSVMRMAFGGQTDEHDYHYIGLNYEILSKYLFDAGFSRVERVKLFGLFHDDSRLEYLGAAISLNVVAYK